MCTSSFSAAFFSLKLCLLEKSGLKESHGKRKREIQKWRGRTQMVSKRIDPMEAKILLWMSKLQKAMEK